MKRECFTLVFSTSANVVSILLNSLLMLWFESNQYSDSIWRPFSLPTCLLGVVMDYSRIEKICLNRSRLCSYFGRHRIVFTLQLLLTKIPWQFSLLQKSIFTVLVQMGFFGSTFITIHIFPFYFILLDLAHHSKI